MIFGTSAALPIAITFTVSRDLYSVIFKDKRNGQGELRLQVFPHRGDLFAYPYKEKSLIVKVAGLVIETLICFCTHYLIFSINLVGRVSFFQKRHFFIRLIAEIVQPIVQFECSQRAAFKLREAFRTHFIYPKEWPKREE